jgi:hypothetical protein
MMTGEAMQAARPAGREGLRQVRGVSERDIAIALVLELAESGLRHFSLLGFYDDDQDFLGDLANRLGVADDRAFRNKLTRVVRRLVSYGVLYAKMRGTHKEYIGEPPKQMEYGFSDPGKANLLTRGESDNTGTPEWEANFLLRRAYPDFRKE